MNKKTIIFDFDGTIADTLPVIVDILNDLAAEFGFRSVESSEHHELRKKSFRQLVKHFNVGFLRLPKILKKGKQELRKRMGQLKPFDGVSELLHELHEMGYTLGVLTSNSKENADEFMRRHQLDFFDFVIAEKKILGKHKVLNRIVRNKRLKREDVTYVGDETRDIDAAYKAGVHSIAVTWGLNSRDALERHKPGNIVDSPEELMHALR